jgi:hypothetical protein
VVLMGNESEAGLALRWEADVPLRGWLQQHHLAEAGGLPHHRQAQARPPAYGVRGKNTGKR